ncbi:MAG: SpoIIE family protein phosphatase [Deltaproteobacteria bacterium]|nr:SpoIIE family protein phosphatase [Deltaproteobacteria bacterium]
MPAHEHRSIEIHDRSSVGEARRISSQMAERAKLPPAALGRVPLIVTELATNLLAHAQRGEIVLRLLPNQSGPGLEIIALDRGPGISDVSLCLADGYSRGGTRGCGLGAVRRLSTDFDILSRQPAGTVVMSRVRGSGPDSGPREFSAICVPAPGETECGDAWSLRLAGDRVAAIVVDGLGHGPLAAAAAEQAVAVFGEHWFPTPAEYLAAADAAMRSTRGAALAMAQIDLRARELHYAGVGNIAARIVSLATNRQQSLVSHGGIVGAGLRKVQQFDYRWQDGDLLVMHSDGLNERWNLGTYAGLAHTDVAVIAGIVYRDAKRTRDDATVLAARLTASLFDTHA